MDKQRLIELHSEGKTDVEIASILNVSRQLLLKKDFEHFKELVLPYMRQELFYKLSLNHVNLGKSGDR